MAFLVVNSPIVTGAVFLSQYTSVWVKPYWTASWQYVPYLFPEDSLEAAAPGDSTARLTWDYGQFRELWGDGSGTLLPINLENYFVSIQVHTYYGTYLAWIGRVVGESMVERGIYTDTGLPRGSQTIECVGLESLLGRRTVLAPSLAMRARGLT